MELLDIRFGREGYPKHIEYSESDDPKFWKKHWTHKNQYKSQYYKKETSRKDISYTLNSQGYREKEWNQLDWNNSYIFLGCSHTVGIGVSIDETIPKLMEKYLDSYCINLGIPGGNNAFSMFNSSELIKNNIKPKAVFFQRTYVSRWFDYNGELIPLTVSDKAYKKFYISDEYINYLDDNISKVISSQWTNICPIIEYNVDNIVNNSGHPKYISRDGTHYNGCYFQQAVKKLYDKYTSNIRS